MAIQVMMRARRAPLLLRALSSEVRNPRPPRTLRLGAHVSVGVSARAQPPKPPPVGRERSQTRLGRMLAGGNGPRRRVLPPRPQRGAAGQQQQPASEATGGAPSHDGRRDGGRDSWRDARDGPDDDGPSGTDIDFDAPPAKLPPNKPFTNPVIVDGTGPPRLPRRDARLSLEEMMNEFADRDEAVNGPTTCARKRAPVTAPARRALTRSTPRACAPRPRACSMVYVGKSGHAEMKVRSAEELLEYTHAIPAGYTNAKPSDPWYPLIAESWSVLAQQPHLTEPQKREMLRYMSKVLSEDWHGGEFEDLLQFPEGYTGQDE